jgi:predicted Zn-dependent peptidase
MLLLALLTLAWQPPVAVKRLKNGLTVVISEDHSSPTFGLCVSYHIGSRLEPRGRTGFAHLFEHMMFEGTPKAPKGTLDRVVEGHGGSANASTRADDTTYFSNAPVAALDAVLELEADRMRMLDFSRKNLDNQRDVVKEEIRENVTNQPYGLFYWTDLYALAFDKWESKHDGYGSFADLDAAGVGDVKGFYQHYYGPNNAVLAVVGDFQTADVMARVEKLFSPLPARKLPPPPDVSEGLGSGERKLVQTDKLARVPAVAIGWRMPPRGSPDQIPLAVLSHLLVGGEASRLYLGLVRGRQILSRIDGGAGFPAGDAYDYDGPTLLTVYGPYKSDAAAVVAAVDEEISRIVKEGAGDAELKRVKAKMRADYYHTLEPFMERATELAVAQQIWGDAHRYLAMPAQIDAVTSGDVQRVASRYLVSANRSVIDRRAGAK